MNEEIELIKALEKIERSLKAYSRWIGKTPTERELIACISLNAEKVREVINKTIELEN